MADETQKRHHSWISANDEWDECKNCGWRRHWYEYNVPCTTITRNCYYHDTKQTTEYEPLCE